MLEGEKLHTLVVVQDACAFLDRSVFNYCIHDCGERHIDHIGISVSERNGETRLQGLHR